MIEFDHLCEDKLELLEEEFVGQNDNADDLAHIVVEDENYPEVVRDAAAAKIIKAWKECSLGDVTIDHLVYVGDHANEPYKSQANQIIDTWPPRR